MQAGTEAVNDELASVLALGATELAILCDQSAVAPIEAQPCDVVSVQR